MEVEYKLDIRNLEVTDEEYEWAMVYYNKWSEITSEQIHGGVVYWFLKFAYYAFKWDVPTWIEHQNGLEQDILRTGLVVMSKKCFGKRPKRVSTNPSAIEETEDGRYVMCPVVEF